MPTEEERLRQNQSIQDWINTVSSPNFGAAPYGAAPAGATTGARVVDQGWEGGGGDWSVNPQDQAIFEAQQLGENPYPEQPVEYADQVLPRRTLQDALNAVPEPTRTPLRFEPLNPGPYQDQGPPPGAVAAKPIGQGQMSPEMYARFAQTQTPIPGTSGFATYEQAHPQGGWVQDPTNPRARVMTPEAIQAQQNARLNAEIDQMTGGLPLSQSERMQMQQYVRGMAEVRKRLENGTLGLQEAHAAIRLLREVYNPLEQRQKAEEVRGRMLVNQQRAEELGMEHFGVVAGMHAMADALPGAVRPVALAEGGAVTVVPNGRGGYEQLTPPNAANTAQADHLNRRQRAAEITRRERDTMRHTLMKDATDQLNKEADQYRTDMTNYWKEVENWRKDNPGKELPESIKRPERPEHMQSEELRQAHHDLLLERNVRAMNDPRRHPHRYEQAQAVLEAVRAGHAYTTAANAAQAAAAARARTSGGEPTIPAEEMTRLEGLQREAMTRRAAVQALMQNQPTIQPGAARGSPYPSAGATGAAGTPAGPVVRHVPAAQATQHFQAMRARVAGLQTGNMARETNAVIDELQRIWDSHNGRLPPEAQVEYLRLTARYQELTNRRNVE